MSEIKKRKTVYKCTYMSSPSTALVLFPDCTEGLGSRSETK